MRIAVFSLCSEPTTELSLWQTLRQISCSHSQSKSKNFTIEVFQSWNRLSVVAHWLTASQSSWADDWQKAEWIHLTVGDMSLCITSLLSENLVILYFQNNIYYIYFKCVVCASNNPTIWFPLCTCNYTSMHETI